MRMVPLVGLTRKLCRFNAVVVRPRVKKNTEHGTISSGSSNTNDRGQMMANTATPSREEIDSKLAAVEARLDSKLATIDGKLDRLFDRVDVAIEASKDAKGAAKEAKSAAEDAGRSASNIKWNVLFTGIGVAAVLIAAWAVWAQGMELVAGIIGASTGK